MIIDWRNVIVGSMMGVVLVGCTTTQQQADRKPDNQAFANDPNARAFSGVIVRLIPETNTMRIAKDDHVGSDRVPNWITVKYDAQTKFFLDNHPATLMDLAQFMSVDVEGHMRNGQMFAETARFSSAIPTAPKSAQASN